MEEKVTRVCKCEKCGNEAEMVVTCTLPDTMTGQAADASPRDPQPPKTPHAHPVKGTAHCSHCGNEADMWIDL